VKKKIPSKFKLGSCTWKVDWSDTLLKDHGCYGVTHYDTNTILLQRPIRGKYKAQNVHQVFWHEFFHAAFLTLNHTKLSKNEVLVDQLGHMVAQLFDSQEL